MSSGTLNINNAWNAVALEERLELISKAQAQGTVAAIASFFLMGSVAYGFDQIWLLTAGAITAFLAFPFFANHRWRHGKPELILSYLAVRTVARRYAFGYRIPELDIILIFRGQLKQVFRTKEEEELYRQQQDVDFSTSRADIKDVWICLLRGGVVILSEKTGGAKLEFITNISSRVICRKPTANEDISPDSVVVSYEQSGLHRTVAVTSKYPAALYVFEKQLSRLIEHAREKNRQLAV